MADSMISIEIITASRNSPIAAEIAIAAPEELSLDIDANCLIKSKMEIFV